VAHNSHLALLPELDVYFAHFGVIYFPATGNKLTPANNSLRFFQWRTEGDKGRTMTRAPDHCGPPKSPNNISSTFSIKCICSRKTLSWNMGRQAFSCLEGHLTWVRLCFLALAANTLAQMV